MTTTRKLLWAVGLCAVVVVGGLLWYKSSQTDKAGSKIAAAWLTLEQTPQEPNLQRQALDTFADTLGHIDGASDLASTAQVIRDAIALGSDMSGAVWVSPIPGHPEECDLQGKNCIAATPDVAGYYEYPPPSTHAADLRALNRDYAALVVEMQGTGS